MDLSKFGYWLQILGNLGLIAGLMLVSVQIKQANDLHKAQMISDSWLANINRETALFGENPAKSMARAYAAPHQLTDDDLIVLDAVVRSDWMFGLRMEGLLAAGYDWYPVEIFAGGMSFELDSPYGLAWWDASKDNGFVMGSPDLRNAVDQTLADLGPEAGSGQAERLRNIRDFIEDHWPSSE
jgi:hypothetical protein